MSHVLHRRAVSPIIDSVSFILAWGGLAIAIAMLLSFRYPDNPWGNLAFAVMTALCASFVALAGFEASGRGAGRNVLGLRLSSADGRVTLSKGRVALRALAKYGTLAMLLFGFGLGYELLIAVSALVVVNAVTIVARPDRRSLLDLVAGSRSVAA